MRPAENIKRTIKSAKVKINQEVKKTALTELINDLESFKISGLTETGPDICRIIMKSNITKFAAAAVVIIAILIGIHYSGGSIDGASVAWADVMEQISSFRPYACSYTVQDEGVEVRSYRLMRLSLTQRREIRSDGTVLVFDLAVPKLLTLVPEKKYAIERILDTQPTTDPDIFKMANSMQNMSSEEGNVQELGVREIDGHIAKGFRSRNKYNDITIWADVQTKLPVRYEGIHVGTGRKITLSEFEFDVDFDEALFSTTAPEGYKVEKLDKGEVNELTKFKRSTTEEDLIEGLRVLANFLDGRFPPKIELDELRVTLKEYIKQNNFSDSEVEERLAPVSEKWTKAYWYTMLLKGEMGVSDFNYVGDGVELGESDTPVIWWLPKDSETYRVIYGDLTVKDVAPENLPE
jgi:outer membrane lipoprotein-sorting protein